jgi:hypothetical protein
MRGFIRAACALSAPSTAASIGLYEDAVRALPRSASYALNLTHVYEIHNDYQVHRCGSCVLLPCLTCAAPVSQAAFEGIKAFLEANLEVGVGHGGFRCREILDVIAPIKQISESDLVEPEYTVTWVAGEDSSAEVSACEGKGEAAELLVRRPSRRLVPDSLLDIGELCCRSCPSSTTMTHLMCWR